MQTADSEMQQALKISSFCILFIAIFTPYSYACTKSECGDDGKAIYFPFRRGHHCGYYFDCHLNEGHEDRMVLVKFFVNHIDYKQQDIQVHNPDNCLLLKHLEVPNMPVSPFYFNQRNMRNATLFECPVKRDLDSQAVPCLGDSAGSRVYALGSSLRSEGFPALESCTKMFDIMSVPGYYNSYKERNYLHFKWKKPNCTECEAEGNKCRIEYNGTNTEIQCVPLEKTSETRKLVATGASLGSSVLLLLLIAAYRIYSSDRKQQQNQLKIERFLEDYKALKPSRYSYADIKRITNQFEEKLGEGAYGSVFKGKLSCEVFVAVKVLNTSSKGNGEEFVNEVGTMGRIHHVNVVRLVGFCADGFKRALVYEFFSNGSLHDFISSADNNNNRFLGWEKLQDIALGIAKGIEYLHQGCDQRILHFDIKPHNVLLDHNFTPKISDFGLAKLCSKDESIVSMTTARGTMGYIAPEVFSRNFGNVSYKSDVYSFGMLLLEIVGGRKNIGSTAENMNEIYYPEWIYNLLEGEEDLRIDIGDGDGKIPKKLAIVGLWCIQWQPVNRLQ